MMMPTVPNFLTNEQILLFDRIADRVVRLRMAMPAILFLESVRPLNFIGSQAMVFFAPLVHALFTLREYDLIQQALEHRDAIGYLLEVIEEKDTQMRQAERTEKEARRKRKKEASHR
jgi:hypothetical protein